MKHCVHVLEIVVCATEKVAGGPNNKTKRNRFFKFPVAIWARAASSFSSSHGRVAVKLRMFRCVAYVAYVAYDVAFVVLARRISLWRSKARADDVVCVALSKRTSQIQSRIKACAGIKAKAEADAPAAAARAALEDPTQALEFPTQAQLSQPKQAQTQ